MIELISELPDNVVGIVARGRVTSEECSNVLRPAMEVSLKRHDKIRLYYEIGSRFPGAGWGELSIGLDRQPQFERVAVVTDTGWVRQTVNALRFLIAGEVRVFTSLEADEGRAWIASPSNDDSKTDEDAPANSPPLRALRRSRRAAPPPRSAGRRRTGPISRARPSGR